MATSCAIAIKNKNGKVQSCYVHFDGNLSNMVKVLKNYRSTWLLFRFTQYSGKI